MVGPGASELESLQARLGLVGGECKILVRLALANLGSEGA